VFNLKEIKPGDKGWVILPLDKDGWWAFVNTVINLLAACMKFRIVFWDVLPCKIIVDRRFRGAYCLHHQGDE
jgi:hypothetical protein